MKQLLLSILIICGLQANLNAAGLSDLTYTISGNSVTITGCAESASGALVIPATIEGYSVRTLHYAAFSNCISLTSVSIPSSVTSVGGETFYSCSGLTSIDVDPANLTYSSVDGVLLNGIQSTLIICPRAKTGSFTIPISVRSLNGFAFRDCINLTSITIPANLISIGYEALDGCTSLTSFNVDSSNLAYSSSGGVLFNKAQTTLVQCPAAKTGTYTIPSSVIRIGDSAFSDCKQLTSISIPNSVTSIGEDAFRLCREMTNITIPNSVTSIGESAFEYCLGLTSMTIPDSVTSLGDSVFYYCSKLTSVTLPSSITTLGNKTFYRCDSLSNVTIPDGVTSIGESAFYNCDSLSSVTIPDRVISVGNYAFSSCNNLTNLLIGNNVNSIGNFAFSHCISLTSVTIGKSVSSIENYAFYGCYNLSSVIFDGDMAASPGSEAFSQLAPVFKLYFYETATGFTEPTWQGYPSEALSLNGDNDGDRFPNQLERLLGTSPLDRSARMQVWLSNGDSGMQLNYSPHSDACEFIVESTTDLTDPDSWQPDENLTFSPDSTEPFADVPAHEGGAVFYRIQVSAKE